MICVLQTSALIQAAICGNPRIHALDRAIESAEDRRMSLAATAFPYIDMKESQEDRYDRYFATMEDMIKEEEREKSEGESKVDGQAKVADAKSEMV
jgi:hypothetical protein